MNPQGTSFIPQRPTFSGSPKKVIRKVYVFTYLSYVFFFGTIFAVLAVLAYGYMLDTQIKAQTNKLAEEEAIFNEEDMQSIKLFDIQLQTAIERMDLHLSPLPIFKGLERSVSQLLTLNNFTYSRENDGAPKMEIAGSGSVLNSLVFQKEVLSTEPLFIGAEFTQVTLTSGQKKDDDSRVTDKDSLETTIPFLLQHTLDTSLLRYQPTVLIQEDDALADDTSETTNLDEDSISNQTDNE